jgi:hypothetical protein
MHPGDSKYTELTKTGHVTGGLHTIVYHSFPNFRFSLVVPHDA